MPNLATYTEVPSFEVGKSVDVCRKSPHVATVVTSYSSFTGPSDTFHECLFFLLKTVPPLVLRIIIYIRRIRPLDYSVNR